MVRDQIEGEHGEDPKGSADPETEEEDHDPQGRLPEEFADGIKSRRLATEVPSPASEGKADP